MLRPASFISARFRTVCLSASRTSDLSEMFRLAGVSELLPNIREFAKPIPLWKARCWRPASDFSQNDRNLEIVRHGHSIDISVGSSISAFKRFQHFACACSPG
jgi:hypothetical protein